MDEQDYLRTLGISALGSRLRRLFESLNGAVTDLYRQELGFEQRWFSLTLYLKAHGPSSVKDAAAALGSSHVAVVQNVKAMEVHGLLTRAPNPEDGRSVLITLTLEGREVAEQVGQVSARVDRAARALLTEASPDFLKSLDALDSALAEDPFASRLGQMACRTKPSKEAS